MVPPLDGTILENVRFSRRLFRGSRSLPRCTKAVERIEYHQLPQNLGRGAFDTEPASRLKAGKGPSSGETEGHYSCSITEFNSVRGRRPQVKGDRLDSSFQCGPLSRDQTADRGEVRLSSWSHVAHSDAAPINARSKMAALYQRDVNGVSSASRQISKTQPPGGSGRWRAQRATRTPGPRRGRRSGTLGLLPRAYRCVEASSRRAIRPVWAARTWRSERSGQPVLPRAPGPR